SFNKSFAIRATSLDDKPKVDRETRYIYGPKLVTIHEARKFCSTYWGRVAVDYHPKVHTIIGLPGEEMWFDGHIHNEPRYGL
ncbi:hypothetical protein FBUS_01751, partial [Fasciolopsis buskii]